MKVLSDEKAAELVAAMGAAVLAGKAPPALPPETFMTRAAMVDGMDRLARTLAARMETLPDNFADDVRLQEGLRFATDQILADLAKRIEYYAAGGAIGVSRDER